MIRIGSAIVFGLCGLFSGCLNAQPLQKFTGTLANGFTDPGEVTYNYRTDAKTGEQIRQGTFRYAVKAKNDIGRFNHNITGNYADNLKEGLWSYKINQKDFILQDKGRYTTGTVSLEAQYHEGYPQGKWRYESVLKSRTGEKVMDKWIWSRQDSARTTILDLNFERGVVVGDFYIKDGNFCEIIGKFDKNGFFDGEWTWKYADSTILVQWSKGFQIRTEVKDAEGNLLHIEEQQNAADLLLKLEEAIAKEGFEAKRKFSFKADTVSVLVDPEHYLNRLFTQTIYQPQYFLYMQIGGDRCIFFDSQTYKMKYLTKGMYQVRMKSSLTSGEVQKYRLMEDAISRMETQIGYIYLVKREKKLKKQGFDAIKMMEMNISLARKYACMGETLKLYLDLSEGLSATEKSCDYLAGKTEKIPACRSREEALQQFVNLISKLEQENQKIYTNIRKNMVE
jgi:hypothetical protein